MAPEPNVAMMTPMQSVTSSRLRVKNFSPSRNSERNFVVAGALTCRAVRGIRIAANVRNEATNDAAFMVSAHCTPKANSKGAASGGPTMAAKLDVACSIPLALA